MHRVSGADMEDLDFTQPARSEFYDPAIARSCFESLGKVVAVAQGEPFFTEGNMGERMYLLLEGEASLIRGKKVIDIIKAGDIFGEIAAITQQSRTATAMARTACRVVSLDAKQFQQGIQGTPEFALMLMSSMINRLRLIDAMLSMKHSLPDWAGKGERRVFDKKLLDELTAALPARPPQRFPANNVILREGDGAVFMYVVLQGRIAVSIKSTLVERIGPGGVVGEMALLDQSPRAATAVAATECELLAINRNDFLALVKAKPAFVVSLLKNIAERMRFMTGYQK
jgi:CRP/FNR family cyclic AMP-dependent transcriptional regulator